MKAGFSSSFFLFLKGRSSGTASSSYSETPKVAVFSVVIGAINKPVSRPRVRRRPGTTLCPDPLS